MSELVGKVAVVTGAAAGIGRAAAMALARAGVSVIVADRDVERGSSAATEIQRAGGTALFVVADMAAGIEGTPAITHECTVENWNRTLTVNLTGVVVHAREIPAMLQRGGGSIVNCASVAGLVGFASIPAYVASKHGIVGLTKTAALEYATQGIRVNAICPGVIDTEMIDRFTHHQPEAEAALIAAEPVGRMGQPDEIADAVVWLCSARSSFVTGQAIAVDGGFVAR